MNRIFSRNLITSNIKYWSCCTCSHKFLENCNFFFFFPIAITWKEKHSLSICSLTCDIKQYAVCSPEGQELERNVLERTWINAMEKGCICRQKWTSGEKIYKSLGTIHLVSVIEIKYVTFGSQEHCWIKARVFTRIIEWSVLYVLQKHWAMSRIKFWKIVVK